MVRNRDNHLFMVARIGEWIWPSVRFLIVTWLIRGILLWCGIAPDEWLAEMIGQAEASTFGPYLGWLLAGILALFATYIIQYLWHRYVLHVPATSTIFGNHHETTISLREVMYWIDEKSAWGRWQKSMNPLLKPGGHEQMQKIHWCVAIQHEAESGKLSIDARAGGSLDRNVIKRDFWDIAYLHPIAHDRTIWRIVVVPKDGLEKASAKQITSLDYSDLRTTWSQVKSLWPEKDKLCDKLTKENLKKKSEAT